MILGIGEIFEKGSKLEGQEQIDFMRKHWSRGLGLMVQYALEPEYQWMLPAGTPPFTKNKFMDQEGNLYAQVRRMYIFFKGQGDHVSQIKKELNFVQLLESVDNADATFILHAKEKSLPFGFTAQSIREIYPGLLSDAAVDKQPDLSEMPEPVIEDEVNEQPETPLVPEKKPRATKSTNANTAKSGTVKKVTKLVKKPVAKKAKAG